MKLKLQKCSFFKKHIQYLGHLISDEGIQPLPEELDSIAKMPTPKKAITGKTPNRSTMGQSPSSIQPAQRKTT